MWSVEDIELTPIELDFSSAGLGHCSATAIDAGGVRLINAIELIHFSPSRTQVEICESCGETHCSPGGWVAFRRIGDSVVWIPAWDEMEKGTREASEYSPPSFLRSPGAPIFSAKAWDRLRAPNIEVPKSSDLPQMNSREAARLRQWSAPGRLLGEFPVAPRIRRDLLITVTDGELALEADVVDQCLQSHFEIVRQMALLPMKVAIKPIEFWLDLPKIPSWSSFARFENSVCFLIDANTAIIGEGAQTSPIE